MIKNSKTHDNRKTHHMSGVLFTTLFLMAAAGFISGQTASPSIDPEREVIVMFKSDNKTRAVKLSNNVQMNWAIPE